MAINRSMGNKLTPEVELFGDWNKATNLLKILPLLIKEGSIKGQTSAANQFRRIVRRHIRSNGSSLGWAPLGGAYKKRKAKAGYPADRILYASGSYYNNIKVWREKDKVYIGIKARTKSLSTKSSLTLGQIARILEYGSPSRNIKARPLWIPSFKEFGGTERIKGFMIWHIRNTIFKRTGVKSKITF